MDQLSLLVNFSYKYIAVNVSSSMQILLGNLFSQYIYVIFISISFIVSLLCHSQSKLDSQVSMFPSLR